MKLITIKKNFYIEDKKKVYRLRLYRGTKKLLVIVFRSNVVECASNKFHNRARKLKLDPNLGNRLEIRLDKKKNDGRYRIANESG